jgi:hypothetical protein
MLKDSVQNAIDIADLVLIILWICIVARETAHCIQSGARAATSTGWLYIAHGTIHLAKKAE